MRSGKSGREPAASSSPQDKDKGLEQKPPSDVPTWPRFDLFPPEHVISGLHDWGWGVVLKSGYLNAGDYAVVREAVKRLCTAQPELHALLSQMNDADLIRKLLELVGGIAGAAYVIGAHGAMTDTARVFFAISGATHMRVRRATSANEQKLRTVSETVAAANGITIPSGHAYKDAERILSDVNERLSRSGDKPVLVDVIFRRLRPRSSRTRRK
jgi:hypothetical protein